MSLKRSSRIKLLSAQVGLDSLAAQALTSPAAFRKKLSTSGLSFREIDELYESAREERDAALIYEKCLLARSSPLLKNAVRLGVNHQGASLRDYEEQFGNRASTYTSPGSVSSMFSPAAYLSALYRNACGLYPEESPYHIDKRRSDLKGLLLSQSNMSKEVSALSLSNEVLMTLAGESRKLEGGEEDQDSVLEWLSTYRLSASTPYHHPHARLRQSRIQKDPKFKQLAANPRVTGLFSGATMAGMAFDIPPELYRILTEEITEENAEALYSSNFGDLPADYLLSPQGVRSYYGLSDEEVALFVGETQGGVGVGEYIDDRLTVVLGEKVYRLQKTFSTDLNFCWLFPKANGGFQVEFNFFTKYQDGEMVGLRITKDGYDGDVLYDNNNGPDHEVGVTYVVTIPSDIPEGELSIMLIRYNPVSNGYIPSSVGYSVSVMPKSESYILKLNKAIRLWRATGLHHHALE
ncbi:hypothetical protein GIV48_26250, partial [Pseudomonas syringae]|uniref:Tc toxin subunit A n=1 Tax=Pseudomonas syringae TaxID=317 RepID=UPI001F1DC879